MSTSRRANVNANLVAEAGTESDDASASASASGRQGRARRSSSSGNSSGSNTSNRQRRPSGIASQPPRSPASANSTGGRAQRNATRDARAEPRIWRCSSCGGETDVRESMARCSHCGAVQWGSYLLLPICGAVLLLATLIAVPALRESLPLLSSVVKWGGLALGTFVSWLGWYILVLDLTKDRIVLVWLMTLALGTVAVLIARFV